MKLRLMNAIIIITIIIIIIIIITITIMFCWINSNFCKTTQSQFTSIQSTSGVKLKDALTMNRIQWK